MTGKQIDRVERQLRLGASYPVSDDAISPNSFVTGRGLQELLSSVDLNVKEYQLSLKDALQELDMKRLEMDEVLNGKKSKPLAGYFKGTAYAENYTPERDISGMYRTRRVYGVMAESGAVTIAGSPSTDEYVFFEIFRDVSADDLDADAKLLGVKLFFTTDAANDA